MRSIDFVYRVCYCIQMDYSSLLMSVIYLVVAFFIGKMRMRFPRSQNKKHLIACYVAGIILLIVGFRFLLLTEFDRAKIVFGLMWAVAAYMFALIYALYGHVWLIAAVVLNIIVLIFAIPYKLFTEND